jgi:hypothetical protein
VTNMRKTGITYISTLLLALPTMVRSEEMKLEYHGAGWLQLGRVENSYSLPNNGNDYEKNWLGNSGGVLNTKAQIDEHWEGAFGLGTIMVHLARGSTGNANKWYPFWVPFVAEARLTYSTSGFAENKGLQLNFGSTGYNYNPDIKNLGAFLMHGYVYPGTLVAGLGNIFGFIGKAKIGAFQNDLILNLETEEKPLYDISVADVITFSPFKSFEMGAGINFSRLIPMNGKATSPEADCDPNYLGPYANRGQTNPCFIVVKNSAGVVTDTILGSLAGTKAILRMRLDPKQLLSIESETFGKDELVLYSEMGLIGLKEYPGMYDKILRRMPVMVGLNLPGFNFLNASVEIEYYANKLSGDNISARSGSWVTVVDPPEINTKRDDWKWSVNASKVLVGNLALAVQVASDHMRLGGNHDDDTGVEAMRAPIDWYWTTKLAFFF